MSEEPSQVISSGMVFFADNTGNSIAQLVNVYKVK